MPDGADADSRFIEPPAAEGSFLAELDFASLSEPLFDLEPKNHSIMFLKNAYTLQNHTRLTTTVNGHWKGCIT